MKGVNLSAWALNHQALIRFFIGALMAAGAYAYLHLGRAEDPPFTFRIMVVQAYWPGATAREMEEQVTDKIEQKLQETPYLDYLRSYSKPGEAAVFVTLREDTPSKEAPNAWYQVRKKVGDIRATLPQGVAGPFFNDEFGDTFGSIYAFTADGFTRAELEEYVKQARQELLRLNDVSKVDIIGAQDEKVYIDLSSKRLTTLGLSPVSVLDVLRTQNDVTPAGWLDAGANRVYLRVPGDFGSVDSIRDIEIRTSNRTLRLGDIAHVYRSDVDPPTFKMRYMGQEAIGLAVSMVPGASIIDLGHALDASLQRIQRSLPVGIEVHQVANQPLVVKNAIGQFMRSLIEALAIVLAVSFVSLGLRTGIVVALSIPLVIAIVFVVMHVCGIDLHRISLGALIIALGLLVDDAIIAVEMMSRKMEEGWDRVKAATFAYTSTAFPMLTGTLITAAAFLPVGLARSRAGEYTFAIFAVVAIALVVSWFVAVIFTPYIGYFLLPKPKHDPRAAAVYDKPFYRRFRRVVEACMEHPKTVIAITVTAFVLAVSGFRLVEQQFFPAAERPELLVDVWLPEGSSFAATEEQVKKLEQMLATDPNVANYVAYVGGATPRFFLTLDQQLQNLNYAQFVILAKGLREREELLERLRAAFEHGFPSVRARAQRLENGPPVGYPVQFRVVGPDASRLRKIADEVAQVMRANPNTRDVNFDWNDPIKTVRLAVDPDKARALGMTPHALAQNVNGLLTGVPIMQFRDADKLIDVVARAEAGEHTDLAALRDIIVFPTANRSVPLSQIANIVPSFEDGVIWRRNRTPAITVRADIPDGIQAPSVTKQILPELKRIEDRLPLGYRIEVGGAQEASAKSQKSIAVVVPLMALVILTLLMVQLQSFQRTVLVLLTAPLGIVGVTISLLVFHMPFGFVTMLGVISLTGMIMRNSLILVDQIDQDLKAGSGYWDAISNSAVRRLRPIMLTALAAILAMIPLSRSVFWGPMAVAIMGGLLVATLLTLFFEPALYSLLYKVKRPESAAQPEPTAELALAAPAVG
ncbi:MAG TPA: efflux RND transporter permease subunit [Burkholderiales bacterium]|nr:efflux RND transporter permease subunit [Burkholderiales bacterium]